MQLFFCLYFGRLWEVELAGLVDLAGLLELAELVELVGLVELAARRQILRGPEVLPAGERTPSTRIKNNLKPGIHKLWQRKTQF